MALLACRWMDGTTMCKAAACMGQYTFRLLEVAGKKVEEVVTVGKTEMDILTRPRPAFFAWCKETRNFGEMLATIMGVQLRQACTENGFVITIQGQRIKFSVVGGKLRGDFHAIQQFLGLCASHRLRSNLCPRLILTLLRAQICLASAPAPFSRWMPRTATSTRG